MNIIDIILILVLLSVTWTVAGEGPWGAALTLISVVLSGLLAMNLFEPVAQRLGGSSIEWGMRADIIAFLGIFSLCVWGFREATDRIMPTSLEVAGLLYEARWLLGAATGYTMVAILLTALHIAPLPREFLGFRPERSNLFDTMAPDRQWLGFTQYVSERVMNSGTIFDGAVFERIDGDPNTVQVWSSFPIRYAQRREQFVGGGAAPPPVAAPPRIAPPPAGGGGGGPTQPAF